MPTSRPPEPQLERPPTTRAIHPSRRQAADYLHAVADVAQATVDARDPAEVFRLIVHLARTLIGAASSTIGTLGPESSSLTIRAVDGASAERLQVGAPITVEGTLAAEVVRTGKSLVVPGHESAAEPFRTILLRFELGPAMCVPLVAHGQVFGAISVAHAPGSSTFRKADVALVEAFAGQASIALEFTRVRDGLRRLAVVDERERIARDLHDGAIQVLFGLGLELQALATRFELVAAGPRIEAAVGLIDGVIQDLRNYIAGLRPGVLANPYDEHATETEPPLAGTERPVPAPKPRSTPARLAFEDRMNALGDTNQAILDGVDVDTIFRGLAHRARDLADAQSAIISTLHPGDRDTLVLRALVLQEQDVPGTERLHPDDLFHVDDTLLAHSVRTGQPLIVQDVQHTSNPSLQRVRQLGIGAAVAVPLAVRGQVFGGLAVCRSVGRRPFDDAHVQLMQAFAAQAAIALEYSRARDELNRLAVVQERERIARELHEGVIQTLFGVGMDLQALTMSREDLPTSRRFGQAVDGIDSVIRDLRNYVFGLRPGILADRHVEHALRELAADFAQRTSVAPVVEIDAHVAARLAGITATDIVQIAREALSNVARHAQPTACRVALWRESGNAVLEVADDGCGVGSEMGHTTGQGLNNMRARAAALRGLLTIHQGLKGKGTAVRAIVPL